MSKRHIPTMLLLTALTLMTAGTASAQTPKIRIMPMGDSITYGSGAPGGYRYPLYVALTNAGYNVDYVGTRTDNPNPLLPEVNHQGLSGWRITNPANGLYDFVYSWFEAIEEPHVILLHIGTNDSSGFNAATNDVNNLDRLITRLAECQPSAQIIVTSLLKRGEPNYSYITNYFNPYVPGKVAGQQALGRKVTFLDMHAYLELSDMPDNLHPDAGGYQKMAAAWFPAITNVIGTNVTANMPAPIRALGLNNQSLSITFNKKLSLASATNTTHYAISGGVTVTAATLSADQRTVTLTTSVQSGGTVYTLTMNNLADETLPVALTIPADSKVTFFGVTPRGAENHVSEFHDYTLVYALDIPTAVSYKDTVVAYSTDRSAIIPDGSFSRIAYYLELQKAGEDLQYLWVSMDAFTNNAAVIGVPAPVTGAIYQQYVSNMNIFCNVPGVATGSAIPGNIEFWPSNYSTANAFGIPGASDSIYDCGDIRTVGSYGTMQIHNYGAAQTLLGFNNWGSNGGNVCLGIGNDPNTGRSQYNPDWTFAVNGATYSLRHMQVYVKVDTVETTPPAALSALAGAAGTLITAEFSEPLATDSVNGSCFSVDHGVTIISATLLPDKKRVNIITTAQPSGASLTLTINQIRDLSGNQIAADSTIAVTPYALPASITANAGALAEGYKVIYTLDINPIGNLNSAGSEIYSYDQSSLTGAFDRVAYYLELKKKNYTTQYVWVSMESFSTHKSGTGVPTFKSALIYQQNVNSMDIKSNVSGVPNGIDMDGGNIEFWPYDYSAENDASVPGASASAYDFGDFRKTTGSYGCMQVHNHLAGQTIFAYNRWNSSTLNSCLGIGNRPGQANTDWTFAENAAADYTERRLYILVRPSATSPLDPPLPPQVAANIPSASNYLHTYTIDLPGNGNFNSNPGQYYSVNNSSKLPPVFSRVAYYLETQSGSGPTQYIWTAMDKFTGEYGKLGVPVAGTYFQQYITNLEVESNVAGITTGSGITTGNIEFWPSSYTGANAFNIPNAGGGYDWGDSGASSSGGGYGSMQVHNHGASQTLLAINHFNNANLCIGIGNRPTGEKDWTFADNGPSYNHRRLYVFVLPDYTTSGSTPAPTVVRSVAATDMTGLAVTFSTALADGAADPANFTLNNGISVTGATLLPNLRTIRLKTSALSPGVSHTLTINGVAARASNAIPMTGVNHIFTPADPALPAFMSAVPEINDYALSYELTVTAPTYYAGGCNYTFDQSLFPVVSGFDRIAYCMELVSGGVLKWAYVSMDAYSADLSKVGVPTADRGAAWQRYVNNMNVYASANAAVTTGVGIATGNIEFWPSNYGGGNTAGIPNAGNGFDWGDSGFNTSAGHGSMQVHNYAKNHTIISLVSFGSDNRTPGLGIGNNPNWTTNNDLDWTHQANAASYTTRNIYVLTRPNNAPFTVVESGTVEIFVHPQSQRVSTGADILLNVYAPNAVAYQWLKDGIRIPGATSSQLAISDAHASDTAGYTVVVTENDGDVALSETAAVVVNMAGTVIIVR